MRGTTVVAVAGLAILVTACGETSTPVGPASPNFELVDPDKRVLEANVNAHVYGSFAIVFEGTAGVITSGPANFPGNPKNAGTCEDGLWINPQGKPTAGSLDKPHPHCVATGSATITVVLEPISVQNGNPLANDEFLKFAQDNDDGRVRRQVAGINDQTHGEGEIIAYAIDASTLGTTNRRVGTLTIDLDQYTATGANQANYFAIPCSLGAAARCLNLVISADYEPLAAPDGVGVATPNVLGFLYWTPATSPFNYTP